jgi:phosphoglycerate dehydrogenase-like enzyme
VPPGFDEVSAFADLSEWLPRADWLVLACPLTAMTSGLVDAKALALLPRGAHLVNVSRGGVVVEADLVAALRSGHIAGASDGLAERVAAVFCDNLGRWCRGEGLLNLVERAVAAAPRP